MNEYYRVNYMRAMFTMGIPRIILLSPGPLGTPPSRLRVVHTFYASIDAVEARVMARTLLDG